jgi:hypothetical protein
MYTESQIYTKKFVFVDGPKIFLENHQQGVFSIWIFFPTESHQKLINEWEKPKSV